MTWSSQLCFQLAVTTSELQGVAALRLFQLRGSRVVHNSVKVDGQQWLIRAVLLILAEQYRNLDRYRSRFPGSETTRCHENNSGNSRRNWTTEVPPLQVWNNDLGDLYVHNDLVLAAFPEPIPWCEQDVYGLDQVMGPIIVTISRQENRTLQRMSNIKAARSRRNQEYFDTSWFERNIQSI